MTATTTVRYRLRAYKPSRFEPVLWQTHDVFTENDEDARANAQALFQQLLEELADARADHSLTHFLLFEGDRLVYQSPRRDW